MNIHNELLKHPPDGAAAVISESAVHTDKVHSIFCNQQAIQTAS